MRLSENQELKKLLEVRGWTYRLLSRIWGMEVDQALWNEIREVSFPEVPDFPLLNEAYQKLMGTLRDEEETSQILPELAADYAILCLGASRKGGADPYESVHLNKDNIMMQDEWEQMLFLYNELGLQRSMNTSEPEDHLAMELECMAILCQRTVESLNDGRKVDASWSVSNQIQILDDHLLKWVPSFVRKVLEISSTTFYKSVAVITQEYLKMDRILLDELVNEEVFQLTE